MKNPTMGCLQIAQMISKNFDFTIDKNTVHRILKKYLPSSGPGDNESWLALFGVSKDKLWSMDLFRVESGMFQSYWVMVVIDLFTRRIIGFSVRRGDVTAASDCWMFGEICVGRRPPKYLSTDWDGLFRSHIWEAGLRVREIQHIRSVAETPWSHSYIESVIGKIRYECTDRILFLHRRQLQDRLNEYKEYFNEQRPHSSLSGRTPEQFGNDSEIARASMENFRWTKKCRGLFHVPTVG